MELRATEQGIPDLEERQRTGLAVVDALPAAILVLHAGTGAIELANPRAGEALESTQPRLVGQPVDAVFAPLDWLVERRGLPAEDRVRQLSLPSGRRIVVGFAGKKGAAG